MYPSSLETCSRPGNGMSWIISRVPCIKGEGSSPELSEDHVNKTSQDVTSDVIGLGLSEPNV